ncbi:MAG: SUMF1/EgtB/PvdO family nonheme iron enzyme [Ignavibacteriales bacterium]|nr:SUMF1/EgtB/PvdO family nonheme iron enzyme [Ignavibacteriales bacterium]
MTRTFRFILTFLFSFSLLQGQSLKTLDISTAWGLAVTGFRSGTGAHYGCDDTLPLFTFELNDTVVSSFAVSAVQEKDSIRWTHGSGIEGSVRIQGDFSLGWKALLTFRNASARKLQISNVVPLGVAPDHVTIISAGPADVAHRLSRSQLFRPGVGPIGVVLPDNAWELGFCDVAISDSRSLTSLARRTESGKADVRRFRTILEPGGSVQYACFVDQHEGDWRNGLRMMFQERWLYDLGRFDNTLFERTDLGWIRQSYLLLLQFAWDQQYYDAAQGKSLFDRFIAEQDKVLGGYEAFMIWPTWPRLGLDQRNQWDMYRDLPGGLKELRRQSAVMHKRGERFFISYNPWDESTRHEDHIKGMEMLLKEIDADGVVLDTWGESSREFQAAADRVKPGIILYSEGMAVPKDMPGIVAGRVHDAIYLPPPLNLNKLIKPDMAIFRVIQLAEGRIHRETAVSFFNGYGVELNIMRPGRPDWIGEEFAYLGRTTKILRENSSAFLSQSWTPLLQTRMDSIWVNRWPTPSKTLFTVYGLRPEGFTGPLFEVNPPKDSHYVSLWNHEELTLKVVNGTSFVPATVDGFSRAWLDTRREGNVDCIALLPNLLRVNVDQDSLRFEASQGTKVVVWAGLPAYGCRSVEFPIGSRTISLRERLGTHEEKFVVQLFRERELLDERVVNVPLATPRLVSHVQRTTPASIHPEGMVELSSGTFKFKTSRSFLSPNEAIPYPDYADGRIVGVQRLYMDRYPVTNSQFKMFLKASRYKPEDTTNFLRHWAAGSPPKGLENHPVVYVSVEDARAYAQWSGKRLPTEIEWQYAAQGTDGRKYPWGNTFDSTRCNNSLGKSTPVGMFPSGKSPFGVEDLIGNVWQLTNDVYDNGSNYFGIVRGGSFYNPSSSVWYIKGGPQPVDNPQILLMVSPALDRNATVGFRCVKDAAQTQ